MNEGVRRCTTPPHNVRNTEMVVRYRFHPWFSQSVHADHVVHYRGEPFIRVRYAVGDRQRWMDVPWWMFDPTTCAGMILSTSPVVPMQTLHQLRQLLHDIQ